MFRPAQRTTVFVPFGVESRRACPCARLCTERRLTVFQNGEEAAADDDGDDDDDASIQHGGQTEQTTVRERGGSEGHLPSSTEGWTRP